jgi:hypothetical protein
MKKDLESGFRDGDETENSLDARRVPIENRSGAEEIPTKPVLVGHMGNLG